MDNTRLKSNLKGLLRKPKQIYKKRRLIPKAKTNFDSEIECE
jgi:hypothetical protein